MSSTVSSPQMTKTCSTGEFAIIDSTTTNEEQPHNTGNVGLHNTPPEEIKNTNTQPEEVVDISTENNEPENSEQIDESAPVKNEQPMPSPTECFEKHLGKPILHKLNNRSKEEIQQLLNNHPLYDIATEAEKLERAMQPHIQHLKIMQNMAKQSGVSQKMRKNWEKSYGNFLKNYNEAETCFREKQRELQMIVRDYVNSLIDEEQRRLIIEYNASKPLSKGRRNHLWNALQNDDVRKLLKTLETVDEVKRAAYRCKRITHGNEDSILMLTVDDDYIVPQNGASKCLEALLETFPSLFSAENIQATIQRIMEKKLEANRIECLDILRKHLN